MSDDKISPLDINLWGFDNQERSVEKIQDRHKRINKLPKPLSCDHCNKTMKYEYDCFEFRGQQRPICRSCYFLLLESFVEVDPRDLEDLS